MQPVLQQTVVQALRVVEEWPGAIGLWIALPLETGVKEVTTVMLMCAVLASLSAGVLLAYGICVGMFHVFRIHSIQVAQQRIAQREAQRMAASAPTVDLA